VSNPPEAGAGGVDLPLPERRLIRGMFTMFSSPIPRRPHTQLYAELQQQVAVDEDLEGDERSLSLPISFIHR
jgi:hypothetical protein